MTLLYETRAKGLVVRVYERKGSHNAWLPIQREPYIVAEITYWGEPLKSGRFMLLGELDTRHLWRHYLQYLEILP